MEFSPTLVANVKLSIRHRPLPGYAPKNNSQYSTMVQTPSFIQDEILFVANYEHDFLITDSDWSAADDTTLSQH